ncbi:hypothetical protein H105_00107 [Trichophyton soudanense CBS 452.61]|uniref:protein-tyrosine-phosphatase n=1 Tax=Trichophyton soudanense CBS 452.61 TaxID=1215331 RepID=A0A022Y843_TRISD|nr:hypothetical protein H105_00107 [Trichophyton soudanense CBS 452.61]
MSTTTATSRPSPAWGCMSTTPAGLPPSTPPSAGQITASFFGSGPFSPRCVEESSTGGYFDLVANTTAAAANDAVPFFHPSASRDREFAFGIPPSTGAGPGTASASASASASGPGPGPGPGTSTGTAAPKLVVPSRKSTDSLLERRFSGRTAAEREPAVSSPLIHQQHSFTPKLPPKGPSKSAFHPLLEEPSPFASSASTPLVAASSAAAGVVAGGAKYGGHHLTSTPAAAQINRILSPAGQHKPSAISLHRTHSIPVSHDLGDAKMVTAERCLEILRSSQSETLLLDVRPLLQFTKAHIKGSLNLCIPTTLLKRPSFNLQKVEETFGTGQDKSNFNRWRSSTRIIVYDSSTSLPKDAALLVSLLQKFTREGWKGDSLVLTGGFSRFSTQFPDWIESSLPPASSSSSSAAAAAAAACTSPNSSSSSTAPGRAKNNLSISLTLPTAPSIAGGCVMPTPSSNPVNPFFSNIRQNVDLIGGVGQLPVTLPAAMDEATRRSLPAWLSRIANAEDAGKTAAVRFLNIEKGEQSRMQQALSAPGTSTNIEGQTPGKRPYRIAGIEKGSKNRYNNIYPYDHCRVKLLDTTESSCDYINASFIRSSRSHKRYIATQAPMPATFNDFWRVVWEQDVRLIVMLTAETDGAQVKCHPYWRSADYGNLRVQLVSEGAIPLDRRQCEPSETGYFIIRHFSMTNSKEPFEPPREITQIQYSDWPDFGTPAKPYHLLRLIEECDAVVSGSTGRSSPNHQDNPDPAGQRRVIVHCSAGCGRTGTFCTVDSVIDMLKRQRKASQSSDRTEPSWVYEDTTDLVASTVEDFRSQRLSMVQSLRQFVLCYESILEWWATHT